MNYYDILVTDLTRKGREIEKRGRITPSL